MLPCVLMAVKNFNKHMLNFKFLIPGQMSRLMQDREHSCLTGCLFDAKDKWIKLCFGFQMARLNACMTPNALHRVATNQ